MIETGFYVVRNAVTQMHYAVDLHTDYLGLAVFELCTPGRGGAAGGTCDWATLSARLSVPPDPGGAAGVVDYALSETFVPDMPHAPHGAIYKGRSYLFWGGTAGEDELVDVSLIDFPLGSNGRPETWRNRFARSAREKIADAPRFRARAAAVNALSIFMPIKPAGLSECRAELLSAVEPVFLNGSAPDGVLEEASLDESGQRYRQFFFSAVAEFEAGNGTDAGAVLRVPAGGSVDVPFRLIWNGDGTPVERALRLKLEADAGYLPRRRVSTDATGRGVVRIEARGLDAGEQIALKINAEHFTALGKLIVEVI